MPIIDFVEINTGVATGGAGTATANASTTAVIYGEILAVYLTYEDSPPASTTDVTLASDAGIIGAQTILSRVNNATDGVHYPRVETADNLGATNTYNATEPVYTPFVVMNTLNLLVAQANVGDSVKAVIIFRR